MSVPAVVAAVVGATRVTFHAPYLDYHALLPEMILSGALCVMLLADLFLPEDRKYLVGTIGGLGFIGAMIPVVTLALSGHHNRAMFGGAYVVDPFSLVF